jgi:hypothetical protein
MKRVGILSDTHDQLERIAAALVVAKSHNCHALLHLGDFIAPFALKRIVEWPGPLYAIFGNNDGEKNGLRKVFPGLIDGPVIWELGGRKIGAAHSREELPADYFTCCDVVCFGHTHEKSVQKFPGKALEINPGEGCGWLTGKSSMAILDLEFLNASIMEF